MAAALLFALVLSLIYGGKAWAATPPDTCFDFDSGSGTIYNYYDYEDNDNLNPACTRDVDIPATISSTPVTNIGNAAFESKQLTSVTMPATVLTIGINAFRNNDLTTVVIPDSVTMISDSAFRNNDLVSLTLGSSLTTIDIVAFGENDLTTVTIPDSVISIGSDSFANNRLTTLILGNSVASIGNGAFRTNNLTSVIIPNSVTSIDAHAFVINTPLSPDTLTTLFQSGDPALFQQVYDSIRLVHLFTADPSNPNNLQDSIVTEADAIGVDVNENGNQNDVLGGHLINPAAAEEVVSTGSNDTSSGLASTGENSTTILLFALALITVGSLTGIKQRSLKF